jgi:hypothetical protein
MSAPSVEQPPIPYPSQLDDVGRYAVFALGASLTVTLAFLGAAVKLSDDAIVTKYLISYALQLSKFLFVGIIMEAARYFGLWDFFKPFKFQRLMLLFGPSAVLVAAVTYVLLIAATMQGVHDVRSERQQKERVARKDCTERVVQEIENASSKAGTAKGQHARCLDNYEKAFKPLWGSETAEQHCKSKKAALDTAERELRTLSKETESRATNCVTAATAAPKK